jgi:hypothetical protein
MRANNVARGQKPFGGYPLRHVFNQVLNGAYKRGVFQPKKPIKADYEFEGLKYEEQ